MYRPQAQQLPFHLSKASEVILRGGKRSGKSTAVVLEFASRILGKSIIAPDGKPIPLRYRVPTVDDPGLYWVIGWDIDHIGQTLHRLLFEPGLFRIIEDGTKGSGVWRPYKDADQADVARKAESKPVSQVLPGRFVASDGWSMENAAANVFESVLLKKNGKVFAKICAYPSSSKHAKQGDPVDGIWVDEDIQNPGHLKEWQDRLTDRNGWLMWSVWPHTKNLALIEMLDKAGECSLDPDPPIEAFQLVMTQNEYIADENKEKALFRMGSDDEIARRDRGELLLDEISMYDFTPGIHVVKPAFHAKPESVNAALANMFIRQPRLPREWTRYLAIDPSHTRTAVMSGAVPPPEWDGLLFGDRLIIEWELVVKKHSADKLAEALVSLMSGFNYEAFIMDQNAGRQTSIGRDDNTFDHYSRAFKAKGLVSRQTGSTFHPGCNKPPERYRAVRTLLAQADDGWPQLILFGPKTWETQREFGSYRKKQQETVGQTMILDEPVNPRVHDCMAAIEYLAEFVERHFRTGTAYVRPEEFHSAPSAAYRAAQARLKKNSANGYVHLGAGEAA